MPRADPALITGVTAVVGTLMGGMTSFATSYLTQGRQTRTDRVLRELDRREDIYARFIELSSELALDALEHPLDNPNKLIGLSALVGRIRLASSLRVLEAAEAVVDFLLETYQQPAQDARELIRRAPREFMAPLTAFTAACRGERDMMLRRL
ncbi:hypothetical protein [Phenylobacterium sp.]|uniref:hypothetical protein n=1 Tax=Phenylobacterium sp. TaxID=1871053 RepID=UPI002B572E33|nr:hypothetical protein [Phenylobacterium sp.]HLZ77214.1 hypothetical protein [Phenylobacterium sp.]